MFEKRPADEQPIEAELVEEIATRSSPTPVKPAPGPPKAGPAGRPTYRTRRARKRASSVFKAAYVLGLVLVAVMSFMFREELVRAYDAAAERLSGGRRATPPEGTAGEEPAAPGDASARPVHPPARKTGTETPPASESPTASDGDSMPRPEPEAEAPKPLEPPHVVIPRTESNPGLAYSVIDVRNLSTGRVSQYEMKVIVPENYGHDELRRMAEHVVEQERKAGLRHAIRFWCFRQKGKTDIGDAFAEVDWAPEGDFARAAEAVGAGSDNNRYRVTIRRTD